ncbi:MAG TPA: hypothetical protein VHM19_20705, partial [Polyangiales bacterium]|nr:hypothetical protein [Polyangiales bacterium]
NVIVDGNDIGPQNSGTTGFAFKMDRFGGMLWGRTLPSTANNRVLALTQDSATGDFVMGGDFVDDLDAGIGCSPVTTASGDTAAFVLRVDPWGGFCDGIAMLGSDSSSETVVGLAPTGDSSADVIAIGSYSNATDIGGVSLAAGGGGNAFYARLQADGTASWANGLNGAEYQFLQDVRATPSGDFVIAGYYDSSITLPTDNGSVTLSGSTHGTILARGSAGTGNLFWATGQRGGGSASTGLRRIAVDREGDVRLAFSASATSQTRFGSAPVPTGYHALHVVMVDGNTGATRRYDVFDYTGTTFIVGSVTASPVGDLLIGGAFMGSGALGTLDFSSQGSFDQYIMGISVEPSWFDDVGCADGQREGFLDIANYRDIAGCSGGFSVPGVTTVSPATCGLHAGDDGNDPSGMGCNVSDLCANGWHVCSDDADVGISSPTGCFNSFGPYDFGFFFATRQKSSSNYMCDDTGSNDIFGCGDLSGQSPDTGTCTTMGLVAFNDSACLATSSWICDADSTMEAATVTHSDASEGGVLCCRD